ncbi:hypothetical protein K440DRAFT_627272 [Wilcoxina mikolae CBS 423.85]|nr:hypothetical protein K440DRAFT_627272 [Wilcoxina mikolae CBS 423.85]
MDSHQSLQRRSIPTAPAPHPPRPTPVRPPPPDNPNTSLPTSPAPRPSRPRPIPSCPAPPPSPANNPSLSNSITTIPPHYHTRRAVAAEAKANEELERQREIAREKERHKYNCRNEFPATMIYARNNGAAGAGPWRKHLTRGLNVWLTVPVEEVRRKVM